MNMGHSLYLYIVQSSIPEERNQTHLFHILSDNLHVHIATSEVDGKNGEAFPFPLKYEMPILCFYLFSFLSPATGSQHDSV